MGCITSKRLNILGDDDEVSIEHFCIQRVVGKGGFGKVNAVTLNGDRKTWYALKKLTKEAIITKRSFCEVFVERDLLTKLKHKRICNLYFAFQDDKFLYLVMDLALGGDLRYQLNNTPTGEPFSESRCRFYIAQLILALEYVHSKRVLHRDIKPENLLMDATGWIKLSDFGIARYMDKEGKCYSSSGTHGYMAPEVFRRDHQHGTEADFFSLGISMYEMLTKTRPFSAKELRQVSMNANRVKDVNAIQKGIFKAEEGGLKSLSIECRDFLSLILQIDPTKRLGSQGVGEPRLMKWFQISGFSWESIEKGEAKAEFQPDVSKMNADPSADIHDLFLGSGERKRLRRLTEEEQRHFIGYEYDYRKDNHQQRMNSFESTSSQGISDVEDITKPVTQRPDAGICSTACNGSKEMDYSAKSHNSVEGTLDQREQRLLKINDTVGNPGNLHTKEAPIIS